jgi:Spy/CpxP family protein refolding chaperone
LAIDFFFLVRKEITDPATIGIWKEEVDMRNRFRWMVGSTRSVPWSVLILLLVGVLLLSGCSSKEPQSASAPSTQETNPKAESVQERPAPSPSATVATAEEASQSDAATEARMDEFMEKLDESLTLTEDQRGKIRDLMYGYFLQMTEGQKAFAGSGGRPDPSKLSDEERERFMKMREGQQQQQAEFTAKIKEIISPDQFEEFQK